MGQQQVKIPTANHIVTMVLNKRNNLQITVHACDSDRQLTLEYHQQYMFLELPEDVQEEFHTMKGLFKNVNDSQGMCCTAGNGHYKVEFDNGKVILKKLNGKNMEIQVERVQDGSDESMTIQLGEKVVSLEDRLERQVSNNRKINKVSPIQVVNRTDAAKNHTVPLQKHFFKLQNGFYLSLFNLKADILASINQSALQPIIITHLDLTGNNLTTFSINQILQLNWENLRKLWLDDNLIEKTNGLEKLENLIELSITKNLLKLQAAQHLSKTQFSQLRFLKISFLIFRQVQKCWDILWSNDGTNFPGLQKLIIVHHKLLPERIKRKYETWKSANKENSKERQILYEIQDLEKISNDKISTLNKINSLKDYPQMD